MTSHASLSQPTQTVDYTVDKTNSITQVLLFDVNYINGGESTH